MVHLFVYCARFENAADRARNHQFFVRANDAHRDAAGVRGNHGRILRIARLVQFDAEEAQPLTNARADGGAFSPMPPAKTSVSNPPSAAAKEPIHFFA